MHTSQCPEMLGIRFFIWKLCAWAGPLYLVGLIFFWGILGNNIPAPRQYWSADEVVEFFLSNNIQIRIGMVGTLFVAPFYFVWSQAISAVMREIEGPDGFLAPLENVGGIATAFVTLAFALMWLTASVRTELRSPQDIQLLLDLGWHIFDMTIMVTLIQMCAVGGAILMDRRPQPLFPTWLGWLSFAAASTFLTAFLMPFFPDGPFAWHGLVTYWLVLNAFFIWMVFMCYYLFSAIDKVRQEKAFHENVRPEKEVLA